MYNTIPIQKYKIDTWTAEENPFKVVFADLTHDCNMECKNCYVPNREIPDMDKNMLLDYVKRFPKRVELRLIGAEPTMRKDLPEIIYRLNTETRHRIILLTNGLKLASRNYVNELKSAGLKYVYISLNGVDNDDWYEQIDDMRCAKNKVMAVENVAEAGFEVDVGCILVKGINDRAIETIHPFLKSRGLNNGMIRFKNVGQLGRYQKDRSENMKMDEILRRCADVWKLDYEKISSMATISGGDYEPETRFFSVDGSMHRGTGFWCKVTDWELITSSQKNMRRGRITQDWNLSTFSEHIAANEFGY